MIAVLILALLLPTQAEVRATTHQTIQAMREVSAEQVVNGRSSRISLFNGIHVSRPYHGLYVDQGWVSILNDSQSWLLVDAGNHFTFKSGCLWTERAKSVWYPCEGEVYVEGTRIQRVIQYFTVSSPITIDITYGWVQLSRPRWLPLRMSVVRGRERLGVTWSNYREYFTEVVVKEIP